MSGLNLDLNVDVLLGDAEVFLSNYQLCRDLVNSILFVLNSDNEHGNLYLICGQLFEFLFLLTLELRSASMVLVSFVPDGGPSVLVSLDIAVRSLVVFFLLSEFGVFAGFLSDYHDVLQLSCVGEGFLVSNFLDLFVTHLGFGLDAGGFSTVGDPCGYLHADSLLLFP